MNIIEVLQLESDNILGKPFKYKDIEVPVLTVGQMIEVNPILSKIAMEDLTAIRESSEKAKFDDMPPLFEKYGTDLLKIVQIITKKECLDLTFDDLYIIVMAALYRLGSSSFQKSIIVVQAMSRNTGRELIAAQNYLIQPR